MPRLDKVRDKVRDKVFLGTKSYPIGLFAAQPHGRLAYNFEFFPNRNRNHNRNRIPNRFIQRSVCRNRLPEVLIVYVGEGAVLLSGLFPIHDVS